jgi:hypothetical protein
MSGWLVLVRAMPVVVPLIAVLTLDAVPVLAMVLDPSTCILGTKDIPNVPFTLTLVVLQLGG